MTASWQEQLDAAARSASCDFITKLGNAAPYISPFAVSGVPLLKAAAVAAAVANFATRDGCSWDPDKETELPLTQGGPSGCKKADGNCLYGGVVQSGISGFRPLFGPAAEITSFSLNYTPIAGTDPQEWTEEWAASWLEANGTPKSESGQTSVIAKQKGVAVVQAQGCECTEDLPTPDTVIDYGDIPPHSYTDESTGCTLIVETLGFATGSGGVIDPVYRITPGDESGRKREGGGGVIGGCNFSPTIYYQPGGGGGCGGGCPPYPPLPDPGPGDEGPNYWQDLINDFIGGLISNIVADQLLSLFEPEYNGVTYRVQSVCETNDKCEPIDKAKEVPVKTGKFDVAVMERLDAIAQLFQPLKDYKQPTCRVCPPKGDFRTITFVSDEYSPDGNNRLRKRFRYRSESSIGRDELVDHWRLFEWDAGPVCVIHSGHTWGTPQVWAASADEGKRVIQHAGREAGVDPNQVGEWTISGSDNPRFGMPGRMRVAKTRNGGWCITERLGSSARPEVAVDRLDP